LLVDAGSSGRVSVSELDPSAVAALRELGGDDFVADLVDTFLNEAPALLRAIHGTDDAEVRRAAHTLKSNGATFGATRFSELCRELELKAQGGDLTGASALADRIEAEYALVTEELSR
jgi:histidine phosphotransfer protein HptB